MRVLVVDDSAFMRRAITKMLSSDPSIEVVGTGKNGKEGLELAKSLKPDVITLDVEMPEMDGLTALRRIMHECPTQVIMVSSLTTEGSHVALQALKFGAADVLAKDTSQFSLAITNIQEDLLQRVHALAHAPKHRISSPVPHSSPHTPPTFRSGDFDVVCICSSTGGPPIVEQIVASLPASFRTPVVIAQHMPAIFTQSMSERLAEICKLRVVHADQRMPLESKTVYVARGGKNVHLHKLGLSKIELLINSDPPNTLFWPSADALLKSAAETTGQRTLAIVLTGIGDDGLRGARPLFEKKGIILAQNEETCVVYGMPKAVTENALVAASLSPPQIVKSLLTLAPSVSAAAAASS